MVINTHNNMQPYINTLVKQVCIEKPEGFVNYLTDAIFTHFLDEHELADLEVEVEDVKEYALERISKHLEIQHNPTEFDMYLENTRVCGYPLQGQYEIRFRIRSHRVSEWLQRQIKVETIKARDRKYARKNSKNAKYNQGADMRYESEIEQIHLQYASPPIEISYEDISAKFYKQDLLYYGKNDAHQELIELGIINTEKFVKEWKPRKPRSWIWDVR